MGRMERTGVVASFIPPPQERLGHYLKRLREGYGYTLRKVEERSAHFGEPIDNSQLSRFEKGKAVPSFDKLRSLAKVFNVPVQNFSDILDLGDFSTEQELPRTYNALIVEGRQKFGSGDYQEAFLAFELALRTAESESDFEQAARARLYMAAALKNLGKLSLTEAELRQILKHRAKISRDIVLRCLLELTHVYRQFGDYYLAGVFAKECLEIAEAFDEKHIRASVLNTLGSIHHDEGDYAGALPLFEEAVQSIKAIGSFPKLEAIHMINLGGCFASLGQHQAAKDYLENAYHLASEQGLKRSMAVAKNRIAEAHYLAGQFHRMESELAIADQLAQANDEIYEDILFMNTFLRWKVAKTEENGTKEKIAFGRLRHLRARIERKFPEVQEFDRYIETHRRNHHA